MQHIFAAATMREAKPLLDAFPGELEWISTSQFGRVHPQLRVRVDDVRGEDAKFDALHAAILRHDRYKSLIFVNSPEEADDIVAKLDARDVVEAAQHAVPPRNAASCSTISSVEIFACACAPISQRVGSISHGYTTSRSTARRRRWRCHPPGAVERRGRTGGSVP